MQEVLNPLNSVNPVQKISFSSNAKLGARSTRGESFQKGGQTTKDNTKAASTVQSSSTNKQKLKPDAPELAKAKDTSVTKDTSATKDTNSAKEAQAEDSSVFDKTLADKAVAKEANQELTKEDLKKISKEVLDALIAFLQQAQMLQTQEAPELNPSLEKGFVMAKDLDLPSIADALSLSSGDSNIMDAGLASLKTLVGEAHTDGSAINSLLESYANDLDLNSTENASPVDALVNQLFNSPELADKPPELKAILLDKINNALAEKLQQMQEQLSKQIQNINISDISLRKLAIDSDTHLPKINPAVEAKLEKLIQLGEKSDQLAKLQELSLGLSEELDNRMKGFDDKGLNLALASTEDKGLKSEIFKLLDEFDGKLEVDTSSIKGDTEETISSIGLESSGSEQLPLHVDSQARDNNFIFHKDVKVNVHKAPEQINTAMKAAELIKTLPDLVRDTNPNSNRELKIKLNPEELGTVDVTITKNANQQISIQLSVTNEAAEQTLKHKLTELTSALGDKGVSISDINVSKSESGNLNDKNQEGKNSFNEGREEQKRRQENGQQGRNDRTKDQYAFQSELFSILR